MLGGRKAVDSDRLSAAGAMEEDEKLKDVVEALTKKRSETEAPKITVRLQSYLDFKQKRRRAAAATEHARERKGSRNKKIEGEQQKDQGKAADDRGNDDLNTRRNCDINDQKCLHRRSESCCRSRSRVPSEACCPPRRRRKPCCPKRRRRPCCPRRRRKRSRCRRRRKRSCSRRRRRRSCRRKRRSRRRRRRC